MTTQTSHIPNSFQTPNAFVDSLMHLLEGDEYKILSFATRHILGWRSSVEDRQGKISQSMFVDGFEDKSGNRYHGTGLSKPRVSKALKALVKYRVMVPVGKADQDGQAWKLPIDNPAIDYEGLEKRAVDKAQKGRKRVAKATQISADTRRKDDTSIEGGTTDVPLDERYDTRTTSGTTDVPAGGTTDVHNQTHKQTQTNIPAKPESEPEKPKRSAAQLKLDAMIEAIADAFGLDHDKVTDTQWGEFRKSGKELIKVGAKPEDMAPLHAWCSLQGWNGGFTSVAMAKNWANYEKTLRPPVVNGYELLDTADPNCALCEGRGVVRSPDRKLVPCDCRKRKAVPA